MFASHIMAISKKRSHQCLDRLTQQNLGNFSCCWLLNFISIMLAKLSKVYTTRPLWHKCIKICHAFSKYFIIAMLDQQQIFRRNGEGLQLYIYSPQREILLRNTLLTYHILKDHLYYMPQYSAFRQSHTQCRSKPYICLFLSFFISSVGPEMGS